MAISGKLMQELLNFLQQHLTDKNDCKSYLSLLFGTNQSILNQIQWDNTLNNIIINVLVKLDAYGTMPDSGQTALCGFFNLISENVGSDVRINIDRLLEFIRKEQEEQAIYELQKILKTLELDYFTQIQQSYSICVPRYSSDWLPENIEDIYQALQDIYHQEDSLDSITKFVALLLNNSELCENTAIAKLLKQWGQHNNPQFYHLLKQTKQDSQHKQKHIDIYLIILIEPSIQQADNNLYIIKSWLIPNISHKSLEISYQTKEKFYFKEIPSLLSYFIQQSIHQLGKLPKTIEFFLPHELFNQAIDAFIPQKNADDEDEDDELPIPIGVNYTVSIRSYQRIKKLLKKKERDEKIIRWQEKWVNLNSRGEEFCFPYFMSGDNWQEIFTELQSDNAIGLKLFKLPSKDILKVIDQTGTPVALWLRNELNNSNLLTDFEAILQECLIAQLPNKVKEKRIVAFKEENHIGEHITLLWDNPNILPPEVLPASLPEVLH
ncbi:hypothetical protein NIES37_72910 (plasmid) [Tolypothrix tenuis PCC 7101]|uniref:Uncharacterized protein n=1 Tax=Tolypothrix tenuis PCC 7101 TaxID=231146 RepID=A0A1Z4NC26_9CYAN|nr:hypothetical protein [Aulosira sp. FACHB-113]BAZ03278.1 hypothetical protein NIES37_72910 [Tolypothrix tenuis PCC 7101]BAZ78672.1 hypothetical protein NIES50_73050 [Aulosira laxa NIES-50]